MDRNFSTTGRFLKSEVGHLGVGGRSVAGLSSLL